ncbi:unnamed protein product [Symbiodinium sp. CCMP2592]|nr:unnamed protein product [Symbiodinium sp. CCMP2592]
MAALFVDIQAAYYEVSRKLIFRGDPLLAVDSAGDPSNTAHLGELVHQLQRAGALVLLGVSAAEQALLYDCVAFSQWSLVGSEVSFLATQGARPGDGLADVLFGSLFAVALRHIKRACHAAGISAQAAGALVGCEDSVLPLDWADDLATLADFECPTQLSEQLPTLASITISTLELLRFRVNLGEGKTELLVDVRGPSAKQIRGQLLAPPAVLALPTGHRIRFAPEYRYLGVVQAPRDTGRRDVELAVQRAHAAWSHALPRRLKQAWMAGRVLPAAYATLCTTVAASERSLAPLMGFFQRAARQIVGSWRYGHVLSRPLLVVLLGLSTPEDACCISRVRLTLQLLLKAPPRVGELFEAAWDRSIPWCELLVAACQEVAAGLPGGAAVITRQFLRAHAAALFRVCRHLSRYGSAYKALQAIWDGMLTAKVTAVIGQHQPMRCGLCGASLPSRQALAAHVHRKHTVVSSLTHYTNGTVCLWCHHEHFSTDRLKYHLKTTPACMHGLRVVVGHAYEYGTGTKRRGPGRHRRLPALRLPGPLNATPAQRAAAAAGRLCTEDELRQERLLLLGSADVYAWPSAEVPADDVLQVAPQLQDGPDGTGSTTTAEQPKPPQVRPRWLRFQTEAEGSVEDDQGSAGAFSSVASLGPGTRYLVAAIVLESILVSLGYSAAGSPWSSRCRPGFRLLRQALDSCERDDKAEPPRMLRRLLDATVSFRMACHHVQQGGGILFPSVVNGLVVQLWRALMPTAKIWADSNAGFPVFVAAHPECAAIVTQQLRTGGRLFPVDLVLRQVAVHRSTLLSSRS